MPIYVCKPGWGTVEPWRHGMPVYAYPFPMDDDTDMDQRSNNHEAGADAGAASSYTDTNANTSMNAIGGGRTMQANASSSSHSQRANGPSITRAGILREGNYDAGGNGDVQHNNVNFDHDNPPNRPGGNNNPEGMNANANQNQNQPTFYSRQTPIRQRRNGRTGMEVASTVMETNMMSAAIPIRHVRHSEVVLVDDVSVHYDKYWLRLLWPGSRGGCAGYIVIGRTNSVPSERVKEWKERLRGAVGGIEMEGFDVDVTRENVNVNGIEEIVNGGNDGYDGLSLLNHTNSMNLPEDNEQDEHDYEDNQNDSDNESMADDSDIMRHDGDSDSGQFTPKCQSTGLYYPSTTTMELLAMYDDGVDPRPPAVTSLADEVEGDSGEPVFCRICREGLHDVDYDFEMEGQGQAEPKQEQGQGQVQVNPPTPRGITPICLPVNSSGTDPGLQNLHQSSKKNRISQPPPIRAQQMNNPYAANPLLSPCECSGSMAFVHYLCVEQWRCRSHHPAAKNGLNCETCNSPYTLPPPPSRPDVNEQEDWLEAMPPHVLAALRRPHPCWQIGAAIVRRKYLRPIAPIITSPIVALYCRARRTLKKRGVSRRRWACSLCRRRARWKCVRCLRSYYCSRQCQNVSWHIVHKHVCYKPVRFWWSVVLYGLAFVYFLPGVLSYPLMYDLGLSFLWISFVVTGIIGGGIATLLKKQMGIDIRGRGLEALVVIMTFWLAHICWGLVWAFFGESSECKGVFNFDLPFSTSSNASTVIGEDTDDIGVVPTLIRYFILKPAKRGLIHIDNMLLKLGPVATNWICTLDESLNVDDANRSTCLHLTRSANPEMMTAEGGENCISDVNTVAKFWMAAVCMHGMSHMLKTLDRHRRAAAAAARHPRPHQD